MNHINFFIIIITIFFRGIQILLNYNFGHHHFKNFKSKHYFDLSFLYFYLKSKP